MSHVPHELSEDFPHDAEKIQGLKSSSPHFARLAQEYHEINRMIHRAESRVEPMDERAEIEMRKKRAALKDEIATLIARA